MVQYGWARLKGAERPGRVRCSKARFVVVRLKGVEWNGIAW